MAYYRQLAKLLTAPDQNTLPMDWATATYSPGWPIRPMQQPKDEDVSGIQIPRELDYPIAANISLTPRTHYGLMPFSGLAQAFENVAEEKLCVTTICREMSMFQPQLVDSDGNPKLDHDFAWLCEKPDGITPWTIWVTRFLESREIFDAGAIHIQKDPLGYLKGLRYIDGSTLFLLTDEHGSPPQPPDPAFSQIIHGTPFGWYDQSEIWYRPSFRRYNAPYGLPPQEVAWVYILILANISAFALSWYREGNMPEGFFAAPEHWTLRQVDAYEFALNARMSSGPAERRRARVFPHGFTWTPTKPGEFPLVLFNNARDTLSLAHGIPPSEFGHMPGAGLGGKGMQDAAQMALYRMGLSPRKEYIQGFFNEILKRFNITDVEFRLAFPSESIDPEKQKKAISEQFANGIITFNEARSGLGFDPVEGGDIHLIIKGANVVVLEAYFQHTGKWTVPSEAPAPGGAQPGQMLPPASQAGFPSGSPTAGTAALSGVGHLEQFAQPSDLKLGLKMLEEGRLPSRRTYSYPSNGHIESFPKTATTETMATTPVPMGTGPKQRVLHKNEDVPGQLCPYDDCAHDLAIPNAGWWTCGYCGRPFYARDSDSDYEDYACYEAGSNAARHESGSAYPQDRPPVARDLGASWGTPPAAGGAYGAEDVDKVIRREGGKFVLRTKDGKKVLGRHDTRGQAERQEAAIYANKNKVAGLDTFQVMTAEDIDKHCGVCDGDDEYYMAPVTRALPIDMPQQGANGSEIVAMTPDGLPPKAAVWKPEGSENDALRERIGGPLYLREEPVYLMDRSMGLQIVPVSYTTEIDGEHGAVIYYVQGRAPRQEVETYKPQWVEYGAVLDYVSGQIDRNSHNWVTHPDDDTRPILIDQGLSLAPFPVHLRSAFVNAWRGQEFDSDMMHRMVALRGDHSTWKDIAHLVGNDAAEGALARLDQLLELGHMPDPGSDESSSTTSSETASEAEHGASGNDDREHAPSA